MTLPEMVVHARDRSFFPEDWLAEKESEEGGQQFVGVEDAAPEGLEIVTLGPSRLTLGSRPLACPKKSRELLIFLICHPQGCSKEEIGLALWPEASPEQLRNVFHVTLSRLRSALGSPRWILTDGKYRINPELACKCDAVAFDREAASALQSLRKGGDSLDQLQQALRLYQRDFLEGESFGEWMFEWRDRLKNLYLKALAAAGSFLVKQNRFEEATAAYEKLFSADPLDEAAARRLMICHARAGQRSEAQRVYRQLVQVLERELQCEPEPETIALFQKLRAQDAG